MIAGERRRSRCKPRICRRSPSRSYATVRRTAASRSGSRASGSTTTSERAAIVSLGIGVLLIVLGAVASRRVAQRVLAPVGEIASLAERIEGDDLSLRLHADGRDELGRLCASFDRMLDRLQAAFARERRFVADASHELRAPLAVLRAETELALRRERTSDEYRAAFASIAREATRLQELVDELLAAARAEVDARQQQTLDAGELLAHARRTRPSRRRRLRGMEVRVETDGIALAQANRGDARARAARRSCTTRSTYGRDDGVVYLRSARSNGVVRIEIADDGPGFTPDALAHATERFWRGDTSRPRGGSGAWPRDRAHDRRGQSRPAQDRQRARRRGGRHDRA